MTTLTRTIILTVIPSACILIRMGTVAIPTAVTFTRR